MPTLRSAVALIAGFAIMTFASLIATMLAAMALGVSGDPPYPAPFNNAVMAATILASALGGYASASLARDRRRGHAMVLALMILVMYAYSVMNPEQGYPRSHFVWLLVLCPLAAVAGGQYRETQLKDRTTKP